MAWTDIGNPQVAAGAPLTTALVTALRDNDLAIAAGESGAPRVTFKALEFFVPDQGSGSGAVTFISNTALDAGVGIWRFDLVGAETAAGTAVGDIDIRVSNDGGMSWSGWTNASAGYSVDQTATAHGYLDAVNGTIYVVSAGTDNGGGTFLSRDGVTLLSGGFDAVQFRQAVGGGGGTFSAGGYITPYVGPTAA